MRGKVLSFFEIQGQGFIHTDDGQKFQFSITNWQASQPPQVGDEVEFSLDNSQQAMNIIHANQAINSGFQQSNQNTQTETNSFLNSGGNVGNDRVNTAGSENFGNQQSQQQSYNPNTQQPSSLDNVYSAPSSHIMPDNYGSMGALYAEEENYNMIDWVKKCLRNYTNMNGRARRKEYWYFILGQSVISLVLGLILGFIGAMIGVDLSIIISLVNLFFILPTFAVGVRRLHDVNRSGWWLLLQVAASIGIISSVVMGMIGAFGAGSWFIVAAIVIAIFSIIAGIGMLVLLTRDTSPETNQWGAPARDVNL